MFYLKLYLLYIKYTVKAQMQFKTNFIIGSFANFYTYFLQYITIDR
jgi:ABC-type uncharacterized transport system permease subunit